MSGAIYPVILSGGSGTRLWPLSRDLLPKQLLSLVGEESLLAATAKRVSGEGFAPPIVVCNQDHRFLVLEQLHDIGIEPEAIIIEPAARNTAPAIAAAAALLKSRDPDALMLVLPSDHIIRDLSAFADAIATAAKAARSGRLVTFGLTPTAPETGYGYIRSGASLAEVEGAFHIARFVEKPNLATAAGYLADGDWSWNSGMFVFPVDLLLSELTRFEPEIVEGATLATERGQRDGLVLTLDRNLFAAVPAKSIDYALMERTERSALVPASLGWSDVGSWSALWEIGEKDTTENVVVGDVMMEDTSGSYLRSHGPLIATLGVKDIVMVATGDVVLVAAKDRVQEVKNFVTRVKQNGRSEATSHLAVHRPWGTFQTLDSGIGYQVRRITVKPGARRSLKKHAERAEHWVVVKGAARVTRDEDVLVLKPNMSIQIPAGVAHRLENCGADTLEVIEVQSGAVLGDDNIIRLSDDYGRA